MPAVVEAAVVFAEVETGVVVPGVAVPAVVEAAVAFAAVEAAVVVPAVVVPAVEGWDSDGDRVGQ